jgi:hypothetical protein
MTTRNATRTPISSGYVPCACRDCMEVAVQGASEQKAYCAACVEAGCLDHQGVPGMSQECRATGAYGDDAG